MIRNIMSSIERTGYVPRISMQCFRILDLCLYLQRVFINSLGRDYTKWASDSAYREERERWAAQSELASRQAQPV